MNGKWAILTVAAVVALGWTTFAVEDASASTRWELRAVSVPYTYYVYETRTLYRTETQPVTETRYRTERQVETTYTTEWERVKVTYYDIFGHKQTRYDWRKVQVPRETVRYVQVPYTHTTYVQVQVPYTERIRVARTGHRTEMRQVQIVVGGSSWSFGFSIGSGLSHSRPRVIRPVVVRRPTVVRPRVIRPVVTRRHVPAKRVVVPRRPARRSVPTRTAGRRR